MAARKITLLALDEILAADRNAKGHDAHTIGRSISRFGYIEPMVLDERTGRLIAGHGRRDDLIARRERGEKPPEGVVVRAGAWMVPVVRGWASSSDVEADAASIALNRTVEQGGWVSDDLAAMLSDIAQSDLGLDGIGFTNDDLSDLLQAIELRDAPPADTPDAPAPLVPAHPVTQPGDVWLLGEHRLVCGDCRDPETVNVALGALLVSDDDGELVARNLGGLEINVAITSPPYAEQRTYDESSGFKPIPPDEYVEWFAAVSANVAAHLADDGSWFVNIKPSAEGLDTFLYVFDLVLAHVREWGWHFGTEFCWERNGVPKHVTLRFKNQYEPIYQFARGAWKMRPNNVRHLSDNAIVPMGPGVGSTTWSGDQGTGPILPQQGQGGARVGDSAAERGRAVQLDSLKRGDPNRGSAAGYQGTPGGPNVGKLPRRGSSIGKGNKAAHQGERDVERTDHSFLRMSPTAGTTSPTGRPRKRKRGTTQMISDVQGTELSGDAGEALDAGFAYPGNRLPTFSGTHEALGHSAAFPVGLPAFFILAYSDPGDVVFDPFVGSGSTIVAAQRTGRVGVGIELSPGYCDVAAERFQRETSIVPVLLRTGEAVDLIARRAETPTEPASIDEADAEGQ